MKNELVKSVMKTVKENLPGIHADALAEYFAEVEQLRKDLTDVTAERDRLKTRVAELLKLSNDAKDLDNRAELLAKQEKDIRNREANQAVADVKLECQKEMTAQVEKLFCLVFRNTTIREKVIAKNVKVTPAKDDYGTPEKTDVEETQEKETVHE